jgi:cob(I)alamin adenosyltransferase
VARIYTKTGDDGTTGLIGGQRVSKGSARVEAYGSVDELNAVLGVVCSYPVPDDAARMLRRIQDGLFTVGANLALSEGRTGEEFSIPEVTDQDIRTLEEFIDSTEARLDPLRRFILPGGRGAGAMLHLARTVARRAERRCVLLAAVERIDTRIIRYLNRLSDVCFVLARRLNHESDCAEVHPSFGRADAGS